MARHIDSDRLLSVLVKNFGHTGGADVLAQLINAQPTADVVEVVRCKYCKHWYSPNNDDAHYCSLEYGLQGIVPEEDFCSYGKRKEVE